MKDTFSKKKKSIINFFSEFNSEKNILSNVKNPRFSELDTFPFQKIRKVFRIKELISRNVTNFVSPDLKLHNGIAINYNGMNYLVTAPKILEDH